MKWRKKLKKITIYNSIFFTIIGMYLICFILNLCGIEQFSFIVVYWFQIFLIVMGILVLTRGILFKLDSSFFAGISLILVGVVFLFRDIFVLPFHYILPLIFLSISLGVILVYLFFKNKLYLKLFLYSLIVVAISCIGYAF